MAKSMMNLGLFVNPVGHALGAWQHPQVPADAAVNFNHIASLVKQAEQARFDFVFFADTVAERMNHALTPQWSSFEPTTLLAALATITTQIGLVATATASYNAPYNVARRFSSLDHISNGRAGWNLVTTAFLPESSNFNRDEHYAHAARYERAHEFAIVVKGLWDSWEDDAFLRDKQSGMFFDPVKMHTLNHEGSHFAVRGPLNIERSPQGHPVIFQAGSSEDGKELAAATAETVFTVQQELDECIAFYADIKSRMARYDRRPEHLKVMPGLSVYVGRSKQEAREKYDRLLEKVPVDEAIDQLSGQLGGFDLSGYPPDGPIPPLPPSNAGLKRRQLILDLAAREGHSISESARRHAMTAGHLEFLGTPVEIADQMEEWFVKDACDGFNVKPSVVPGDFEDFVTLVVPELQRRGRFRSEYDGSTLRSHLGLPVPKNRFANRAPAVAAE